MGNVGADAPIGLKVPATNGIAASACGLLAMTGGSLCKRGNNLIGSFGERALQRVGRGNNPLAPFKGGLT